MKGGPKTHVHPESVKVILLGNRDCAAINKEEVVVEQCGPQSNVSGFLVKREKFVRNRQGRGPELTEAQTEGMWPQAKGHLAPPEADRGKEVFLPLQVSGGNLICRRLDQRLLTQNDNISVAVSHQCVVLHGSPWKLTQTPIF